MVVTAVRNWVSKANDRYKVLLDGKVSRVLKTILSQAAVYVFCFSREVVSMQPL